MNRDDADAEQAPVSPRLAAPPARSSLEGLEDAELMAQLRDGDRDALTAVYHRYGRPCYGLARRILTDDTLAQDVVQEVFLALWRDPTRYDGSKGSVATWLLSLTHHKAVDVVRREENMRRRRASAEAAELLNDRQSASAPDEAAWGILRRDKVRSALRTLPPPQREALGLAYYGGYTQREIAGLTNTPIGTVKTRMLAGMRKLRVVLATPLDEEPAR